MKLLAITIAILVNFTSCNPESPSSSQMSVAGNKVQSAPFPSLPDFKFQYELEAPNEEFILEDELDEISGLGISDDGKTFYAVQDEDAIIYELNAANGKISKKYDFGKSGDYEGIEMVGDKVYVVKSSGTIYMVSNPGKKSQEVESFNTFLDRYNNVEGLCYDSQANQLLLGLKGRPIGGELTTEYRYSKAIYAFDLNTKKLLENPRYIVSLEAIQYYLENNPIVKELDKLVTFFTSEQENMVFNPSGISIHPATKDIYIISSAGKLLIVLDASGNIKYIERLDRKMFQQPEGICFDQAGNLYISNEGKHGKARIFKFDKKN